MNTSSSDGRETLTERIGGWPGSHSANRRGTNCSPSGTPKVTAPSAIVALDAEALVQRGDRGGVVVGRRICTRSLPTLAFSASGVSEHDDRALVHDRDAVAVLGLVHVVGGEEDRDVLALP